MHNIILAQFEFYHDCNFDLGRRNLTIVRDHLLIMFYLSVQFP